MKDLWRSGWKNKAGEPTQKKISEIHKDDASEKRAKQAEDKKNSRRDDRDRRNDPYGSSSFPPPKLRVDKDRHSTRGRTPTKREPAADKDGWTQTTSRGGKEKSGKWGKGKERRARSRSRSRSRDRGDKNSRSQNSTPRGKSPRNGGGGKAQSARKANKKEGKKKPAFTGAANAFSVFGNDDDDNDDEEDEKSNGSATESDVDENNTDGQPSLSYEEADSKIKMLVSEFFQAYDKQEAKLCMQELGTTEFNPRVVQVTLDKAIDGSQQARDSVASLFQFFCSESVLTKDQIYQGCTAYMTALPDLICDVPKAVDHMAKILAPLVLDGILPFDIISNNEGASELKV